MEKKGIDSSHSASFAKITRPSVDTSVLRHRLFTRLDESQTSPITWISGPGGCGKITLLSSYVVVRKYPTLRRITTLTLASSEHSWPTTRTPSECPSKSIFPEASSTRQFYQNISSRIVARVFKTGSGP